MILLKLKYNMKGQDGIWSDCYFELSWGYVNEQWHAL